MTSTIRNENGRISIDTEVIAQYASHAALDCFGIVGMAEISMKDGIVRLLNGNVAKKGVNVIIDENDNLTIEFHIIVAYGVNIKTVVDNLISSVKYQLDDYMNIKVSTINVYVHGVKVIDD